MNEILLKLAMGQIAHQQMNRQRLDEIVELTANEGEANVINGFDSYVAGALGPLIAALHDDDVSQLPDTIERIGRICETICALNPRSR